MFMRSIRSAAAIHVALIALTLAACETSAATSPDGDDAPATGNPGGSVPSAVLGGWRYGTVSSTNFWDDHTGVYAGNAYGISDQYEFAANGTFTEYIYIYTQAYSCRTQAWVEMRGTVRFDDAQFTKRVTSGRFKTVDSCASSHNKDRAMTAAEATERSTTHQYTMRTDASGKTYLQILDGRYDRAR